MCRNTFAGPPATFGDHPTAADSTAGGGLRGFPGGLVDRQRAEFRGVDLDAVRTRVAARLYGADQPDDVQVTVAGQFALRPSMFQEVVGDQRSVVQLHGRHAGAREVVQHTELRAAVVKCQTSIIRLALGAPARRSRSTAPATSGMADHGKASTATSKSRPANLSAIARSRPAAAWGSSVHSSPPRNSPALTCRPPSASATSSTSARVRRNGSGSSALPEAPLDAACAGSTWGSDRA